RGSWLFWRERQALCRGLARDQQSPKNKEKKDLAGFGLRKRIKMRSGGVECTCLRVKEVIDQVIRESRRVLGLKGDTKRRLHRPKKSKGVREHHEVRVEDDREQNVRHDRDRQWDNDRPVIVRDLPVHGYGRSGEYNHGGNGRDREEERDAETSEDLGHFEEKVGSFDFLLGRSPLDIVREQVGEDGLAKMDRQATKEDEATTHQ
ncbi:2119_t:CDS:2, partial [Acaulospora colombiana]